MLADERLQNRRQAEFRGRRGVFFRARLTTSAFGAGEESLDAKLVAPEHIPWEDLAFPSTRYALRCYLKEREQHTGKPYLTSLERRLPG